MLTRRELMTGLAMGTMLLTAQPLLAQDKPFAGVEIKVAMIDEPREWAFRDRLAEFEEKTGIKVTIDTYGFDNLFNKILTASAGKTGEYDVVQMHVPDMALFDEKGFMLDITDWVTRDADEMELTDIHPAVQESHMKYKDRYYGVPTHVGGMNFYYRKDIFDAEGYAVPTTWEEVLEIAKKVDEKYGPDLRGLVLMGKADIQGASTFQNIWGQYGGEYFDASGKPTLNNEAGLKAMNMVKELTAHAVDGSPSYSFDEAQTAFKQGRAAMVPFWDSGDNFFGDAAASQIVDKWAIAPMPGGRATNGGWSVQISKDSKNPEAAFEFLKWIVSPEMEKALVPLTPSIRTSILEDAANDKYPAYKGFLNLLKGNPFNFPKVTPNLQILQEVAEAQNAVMTGQATPEEALAQLQSDVDAIAIRFGIWTP
jgi:multiple sugar transport system substrate-binding protein